MNPYNLSAVNRVILMSYTCIVTYDESWNSVYFWTWDTSAGSWCYWDLYFTWVI